MKLSKWQRQPWGENMFSVSCSPAPTEASSLIAAAALLQNLLRLLCSGLPLVFQSSGVKKIQCLFPMNLCYTSRLFTVQQTQTGSRIWGGGVRLSDKKTSKQSWQWLIGCNCNNEGVVWATPKCLGIAVKLELTKSAGFSDYFSAINLVPPGTWRVWKGGISLPSIMSCRELFSL